MAHETYLSYEEYKSYGGTMPEADFNKAGAEAQANTPTVTSFSTDGYSESYGKALSAEDAELSMNRLIVTSLYGEYDDKGVPLLYKGVCH